MKRTVLIEAIETRITGVRAVRSAPGENGAAWGETLAAGAWMRRARVLKQDTHSWVVRATVLGRDVVVKRRALHTPARRIKSALRMGHGDRHWRGAGLLTKRGIPTAAPIVLLRGLVDGVPSELLVLEYIPGPTLLECMAMARDGGMPVREQHAIARAVGEQVLRFSQGLQNRDHKPSNLVVRRNIPAGASTVAVIDCVGVYNSTLWRGFFPPLASLLIEPIGCGVMPRRTLRMRVLVALTDRLDGPTRRSRSERRGFIRVVWLLTERRIRKHGDPTPLVNPLGG